MANSKSSSPQAQGLFSVLYNYSGCEEQQEPHFLDSCHLCSKHLGFNSDIFMYRGDTPFCSEDCRQEQIDVDEAKEKSMRVNSRSLQKSDKNTQTLRTGSGGGTVAVA